MVLACAVVAFALFDPCSSVPYLCVLASHVPQELEVFYLEIHIFVMGFLGSLLGLVTYGVILGLGHVCTVT